MQSTPALKRLYCVRDGQPKRTRAVDYGERRPGAAALAAARILGANHEVDALLDQPLPGGGDAAPSVRAALADALAEEDAGAGVVLAGSDVPPPPRPFDTRPGPAARRPPDPATETGGGL